MDGVSEDEGMDEPIVLWEGGMEGGVSAITIGWDDTWGVEVVMRMVCLVLLLTVGLVGLFGMMTVEYFEYFDLDLI